MIFVANNETTEVKQPGEEPLDFPTPPKSSQRSPILCGHFPVLFVRRNHFHSILVHHFPVKLVTVVCLVPNQSFGNIGDDPFLDGFLDECHFSRRSTFCPQGERKTMAVCNTHDLGALAALGLADESPPFLAGTNVPSTKHSFRSKPPASCRCLARVMS